MLWIIIDRSTGQRLAIVGLIPFLIGIANLIIYFIEKKKKNPSNGHF
jgi:hypothetical protein